MWHENHSTDVEKAKSFYSELLGWEIEPWKPGSEMDYSIIKSGEQMHGGFMAAQGGAPSHWLGHVLVENADETAKRAEAGGGRVIAGPMDMPEVGRFAIIADPQGAVISIFQGSGEGDMPSEGVFVWDELGTSDPDAAARFYGDVLGWTASPADPNLGGYRIFTRGEDQVAGLMKLPEDMPAPPHWQVYIGTDDVDKTTARAKELGATVIVEPMDIPNDIGRFSILQDPAGAGVGLGDKRVLDPGRPDKAARSR